VEPQARVDRIDDIIVGEVPMDVVGKVGNEVEAVE
jgi:hypothetical protein